MPPKQSITKEKILKAALDIVRKKGINEVSARNIAQKLNCSTQPIYSVFKNMKDLEKTVINEANAFVTQKYFMKGGEKESSFLNMGMASIEMARKEKHIYHLLYHSGKIRLDFKDNIFPFDIKMTIEGMKHDPVLNRLEDAALERIFFNMWVYTHGLASLVTANPSISDDLIISSLDKMGKIIIEWEIIQKEKKEK